MSLSSDPLDVQCRREEMRKKSLEQAESIVKLAGFDIYHAWELANRYWPNNPAYDDVRMPWWLFLTDIGPVQLGWRKKVIHIEWSACAFRGVVTEDNVTKEITCVHAWSVEKAVEYMRALRTMAKAQGSK